MATKKRPRRKKFQGSEFILTLDGETKELKVYRTSEPLEVTSVTAKFGVSVPMLLELVPEGEASISMHIMSTGPCEIKV